MPFSKLEETAIQFPNSSPTENQEESDGKERPAFGVAEVGIRVRVDSDRKGRCVLFAEFAMFVFIAAFVCSVYTGRIAPSECHRHPGIFRDAK